MAENTFPVEAEEIEATTLPQEEIPVEAEAPVEIPVEIETPVEIPAEVEVPVADGPTAVLSKPFKQPLRKRVPLAVRGLLQVLSFVLCVVLMITILATVLVADLSQIITGDGIKTLITGFLTQSAPARPVPRVVPAMGRLAMYSDTAPGDMPGISLVFDDQGNVVGVKDAAGSEITVPSEYFFNQPVEGSVPAGLTPAGLPIFVIPVVGEGGQITGLSDGQGNVIQLGQSSEGPGPDIELPGDIELPPDFQLPDNIQLPTDFTNVDALTDWAVDTMNQVLGEDAQISREDVKEFIEESTVTDFLAEKVSDIAGDILSGTSNTTITAEEIIGLVKENKELLQDKFQVEITDEQMQVIEESITTAVGDGKELNNQIQAAIKDVVENEEPVVGDMNIQDILDILNLISSRQTLLLMVGICLAIVLLLLLLNFYNIPCGLGWAGFACLVMGGLLSALLALLPTLVALVPGDMAAVGPVILSFGQVFAPIHYGVLGLGVALLVGSTIWRIVRMVLYRKRLKAAGL